MATFAQRKEMTPQQALPDLISVNTDINWATYVYSLLKDYFKCKDIKNNMWFFKDNDGEWYWDKDNHKIRIALYDIVHAEVLMGLHALLSRMQRMDLSDKSYPRIKNQADRLADMITGLEKDKFKNEIIKICRDIFYEEN